MAEPGRVLLLGASGTQGRATAQALVERGHEVIALLRPGSQPPLPAQVHIVRGEVCDPATLPALRQRCGRLEGLISCLASRSGIPAEAWAVDHLAHRHALRAAPALGVQRFVLLSALCVQRPRLAFQQAKLAFEAELRAAPLDWCIVRPTAFFKSLSGQLERMRRGLPFLVFGDGRLTACRPIGDADLAHYLVDALNRPEHSRQTRPIGGPGPALCPLDCGHLLAEALGVAPRFRHVPPALLSGAAALLQAAARLRPALAARAELARIGHYYATESMLVWDRERGAYSEAATPATGRETLAMHYARLVAGERVLDLGAHALFRSGS